MYRDMREKPTVCIETTVLSYLVAKPSRDLIVAAHQQTTQDWWEQAVPHLSRSYQPWSWTKLPGEMSWRLPKG